MSASIKPQVSVPVADVDAAFKASAHDRYAQLRARGAVHPVRILGGIPAWMVVDHAVATEALAHPDLGKDETPAHELLAALGYVATGGLGPNMLNSDPPDHSRLRRLVTAAFTRPRVEALRPRVVAIADELADALDAELDRSGTADLVASFTAPLPTRVISELLGVPAGEHAEFRTWTRQALGVPSPEQRSGFASLNGFLAELVAAKRQAPGDDLLSALVAVRDADDGRLSEEELVGTAALLVIAGHDTTVNLLGNAMVALLGHPDQARLLVRRPELIPGAVEEFLRHDPPVEYTPMRFAAREVELGGVLIQRGEIVVVSLSSAGRSDAALPEERRDVLDVTRPAVRHLSFGHGIHHCLGAPLARLETGIALDTLLRRFPDLHPAVPLDELAWLSVGLMRGPLHLPVRR